MVRRRAAYELRKAQERAHILEGFLKALQHLDAIIKLIRASKTPAEAKQGLTALEDSGVGSGALLPYEILTQGTSPDKVASDIDSVPSGRRGITR